MQDKHNSNGFYDLYHNPFTGNSEPRGYTYVAGYGFSPPPRADYERRMIRTYSSGIAMLLCFLLLSGPVYQLILTLETMLFGQFMTYDGYTAAAEIANMGAYVLALLLPAVLYCRRIRIPTYNAFPLSQPRDTRIALAAIPITLMTVVVGAYTASAMSVFFAAFGLYPTSPVSAVPTGVVPFVLYFLSSAVLPAIVEELVFRGAIMQSLRTSIVYVVYLLSGFIAMGWLLTRYSNMFQLHASNTVMSIRGKLTAFFSTGLMLALLALLAFTTSKYFLVI